MKEHHNLSTLTFQMGWLFFVLTLVQQKTMSEVARDRVMDNDDVIDTGFTRATLRALKYLLLNTYLSVVFEGRAQPAYRFNRRAYYQPLSPTSLLLNDFN